MKDYFFTLIITSVAGAVCAMLTNGGFGKYMKYIAALICAVLILAPLRTADISKAAEELTDEMSSALPDTAQDLYRLSGELAEERAEEYISEILFSEFGIKPLYSSIDIDWAAEEPIIESIQTAIPAESMDRAEEIRDFLKSALGGEVEIIEG